MKKFLTTLLTSMVIVCVAAASVFADKSPTDIVDITGGVDSNGNPVTYTLTEMDSAIPPLTVQIASPKVNVPEAELEVLWQKELTSSVLPATFTYNCAGTDGRTLYSFHWNGTEWEYMNSATGPSISTTYTSLSPVGVVVRIPSSSTSTSTNSSTSTSGNSATSPKTGETVAIGATLSVVVIACSAAFVVAATSKKEN